MSEKEATARIKINKLLEAAGWRFFPEGTSPPTSVSNPASRSSPPTWTRSATTSRRPANRELITRFEKKIQATLALVWGEEKAEG